jgi:hypothetical protein
MTEEQDQMQPERYSYKLRLEWREPKKKEEGEITPMELQEYITELLREKTGS